MSNLYRESQSDGVSKDTFLTQLWDTRTFRVLFTALLFFIVLAFLRAAKETLTLFLFAILFAYFLAPLVGKLERPLHGRGKAILAVYVLLGIVLAIVGFAAGPRIADESRALASSLPSLLDRLGSGQLVAELGQHYHWADSRVDQIQKFLMDHRADILGYGRAAGVKLAALILASLTLVAYTVVLSIMRVPYAFILGPLAGFLEFIPVVGPAIAAASVVVISILAGYPHAGWLIVFLGIWRLIQDYVSAPRIMGRSLEINPLMQIFAVLAGGEIAGVVGALISVPVVATLRIIWRRIKDDHGTTVESSKATVEEHTVREVV